MPGILLAVIVGLATCQVALFVTSIFLHRTLAHRALTLSPGLRGAFRLVTWLATGIKPREWVAVHRRHHAYTDVEGDPHSPVLEGFAAIQIGNLAFYRRAAHDSATVERYARDLRPDRLDRIVYDKGWIGLGVGYGLLVLVFWGRWELAAVAAAVHVICYLGLSAAVNAVGHRFGRRPFEAAGRATNSQWLAWLVAGEGLHNNHHAAPTSAHFAMRRREVDPSWWLIVLARKLGLLTVRHSTPKLTPRAERAGAAA